MMKILLSAGMLLLTGFAAFGQSCDLFFSEYLEGTSNNKAIEVYNPTSATIDLADYKMYRYNNGSPTPTDSLQMLGTLAPGAVYVAGNPSAVAGILSVSDTLHTITFFNGDDAMELRYMPTNTLIDVIGLIGNDPGTNWPVGTGATNEFTLVRMFPNLNGESNWTVGATEWDVYPANTLTFLGAHSGAACCTATTASVTASACNTYTWAQNGTIYTTSGSYNDTLVNVAGCDSVVTLNLTINYATTAIVTASACNTYTWAQNGTIYTTSGSYNDTLVNAAGCDSIVTLNLAINSTSATVTAAACDSYTWAQNGTIYTTSGSYIDTLVNAAGCDSIVTLNLTITYATSSTETVSTCGPYTWPQTGETYTWPGMFTDTLTNAAGCDSIVILDLLFIQPVYAYDTVVSCDPYTWSQTGETYTMTGTYTDTLASVLTGCDSIQVLILQVSGRPVPTAVENGTGVIFTDAGDTYQWIDCTTGQLIPGETGNTYTPAVNGTYASIAFNNAGCSDTSNCVTIDYIGLNENTLSGVMISPNPATDLVTIVFNESSAFVTIRDAQGKLIGTQTILSGKQLSLAGMQNGVYFFELTTPSGRTVKRVVKQ